MGNPIETGRTVLHSAKERTERVRSLIGDSYAGHLLIEFSGIGNYRRLVKWNSMNEGAIGTTFAFLSLILPLAIRGVTSEPDSEFFGTMKAFGGGLIDASAGGLIGFMAANGHGSLPELLAYKTIANLASHALVDALRSGVDYLKGFRPPSSPATLTV
ncbi:MAG: hypothetical protein AAB414_00180 [Patescibacteria group bacterium]